MAERTISASRMAVFLALVVLGFAADLTTKNWIFSKLGVPSFDPEIRQQQVIVLVPGIFSLTTSLNPGALFGLGQGMTPVFAGLSLLAALGICYWIFFGGAGRDSWLTIALGAIMAGIFGNLYDRLGLPKLTWPALDPKAGQPVFAVRDWLHFEIQKIGFDWPVFNLADSFLVLGAAMLFWHVAWRERKLRAENRPHLDTAHMASK